MTNQEIFDAVATHLRNQKVQSYDPIPQICLYRGPNNTKCAIGFLIEDNEYSTEMENKCVTDLNSLGLLPIRFKDQVKFLRRLQLVHDGIPYSWEWGLERVASDFKLIYR